MKLTQRALPRVRLRFLVLLYLSGIVIWSAVYYHYRNEFVVNPDVLRVEASQIRLRGERLVDLISRRYADQGLILHVLEPQEWSVREEGGARFILLEYRFGTTTNQASSGNLVVSAHPTKTGLTVVRPADASPGTETSGVPFDFAAFDQLVTKGYADPRMSKTAALYFSISIMTTLGLGDIVPRSDLARFMVVAQVLYGLTVFALIASVLADAVFKTSDASRGAVPPAPHGGDAQKSD